MNGGIQVSSAVTRLTYLRAESRTTNVLESGNTSCSLSFVHSHVTQLRWPLDRC